MTDLFDGVLPDQRRPLRELPVSYIRPDWSPPSELPDLTGAKRIGLDIETKDPLLDDRGPGVRRGDGFIVGIAVAIDDGPRCYLPMRHEGGGNLDPNLVLRWARSELGGFRGEVVGANLLYDLDWLASEGIVFPSGARFLDVQNAEPLLDENRRAFGLEWLARDYLGETKETPELQRVREAYKFKSDKALKQNLWRLPAGLVGSYAEGDVDLPLRILPLQLKKLEEEELLPLFDLESRLVPLLLAMRQRGVRVDRDRATVLRDKLVRQRSDLLAELRRLAGPKADWLLPDVLGPVIEAAGVPIQRTEKTGQYRITKELLERYSSVPICALIREGRKLNTVINTFLDGYVLGHSINGRIHCEFNQLKRDEGGTIARFSSSNPNLQNIPARDDELAPLVRGLFIPEDGETWEQEDLSQIEYRFLTHYAVGAGADEARRRYQENPKLSFHNMTADMLGATDPEGETYKRVKNTNFCKVYGGGAGKIAETFNISLREAQDFVDRYDRELPFVSKTFDEAERLATRRGYVRTILKRRRRFPFWEPRYRKFDDPRPPLPYDQALDRYGTPLKRAGTRNALNGMLQGGAADYMKKSMVDMWESGICDVLGAPLLTVHDELNWSVPLTPAGEEASREARRLFETAIRLRVPVLASAKRGDSWGACE